MSRVPLAIPVGWTNSVRHRRSTDLVAPEAPTTVLVMEMVS